MSIKALTIVGLNLAIETNKDIVQIFNRNFNKTFFMLKEDYVNEMSDKEGSFYNFKMGSLCRVKDFDITAYNEFKKNQFTEYGEATPKSRVRQLVLEYVSRMYDGIQFVSSEDEIIPNFYIPDLLTMVTEKKQINWLPEHFLKGTQVTVSPVIAGFHSTKIHPSVFTIQGIRQNGPNSFVLKTTVPENIEAFGEGETYSFNISHVENIVTQGKGIIKIDSWRYFTRDSILQFADASKGNSKYAKKGHWLTYEDTHQIVRVMVGMPSIPRGAVLDTVGLMRLLLEQSFVKKIQAGESSWVFVLYSINKKRAKRFIKQNLNRFLSSARKEQERQDKEMDDYYFREMEKEFDEEFGRRHPEVKESNDQQDTSGRAEVDESYFADRGDASNNDASVDPDGRRLGDYCHPGDVDESYFD